MLIDLMNQENQTERRRTMLEEDGECMNKSSKKNLR